MEFDEATNAICGPGGSYQASEAYTNMVRELVQEANPNDPETEIWNEQAIQRLANYFSVSSQYDRDELSIQPMYFLYDLLKFTLDEAEAEVEELERRAQVDNETVITDEKSAEEYMDDVTRRQGYSY